jgi:hypothetical protein
MGISKTRDISYLGSNLCGIGYRDTWHREKIGPWGLNQKMSLSLHKVDKLGDEILEPVYP